MRRLCNVTIEAPSPPDWPPKESLLSPDYCLLLSACLLLTISSLGISQVFRSRKVAYRRQAR